MNIKNGLILRLIAAGVGFSLLLSACGGSGDSSATQTPSPSAAASPTVSPTVSPSAEPTAAPAAEPTAEPTEEPAPVVDLYSLLPEGCVFYAGFEDLNVSLAPRGGVNLEISGEYFRDGDFGGGHSLLVSGRTQTWNGVELQILPLIERDKEYTISLWAYIPEGEPTVMLQLSTQINQNGGVTYSYLRGDSAQRVLNGGKWTRLEGSFSYFEEGYESVTMYVESIGSGDASFYIDDVILTASAVEAPFVQELAGLKDIYADYFMLGNAVSPEDYSKGGLRPDLLTRHFNAITPGNIMKPDSLQRTKGNFTFGLADALVEFAQNNGITVIGHTLAWHQQSPAWLNAAGMGREEAIENLTTHVKTVVEHFKGKIYSWDVVNEAFDDGVSFDGDWRHSLRKSPWYNAIGDDYIEIAFRAAREADPGVLLYYNDYNLDFVEKSKAVAAMITDFKERGVPIDGVGMQGHYNMGTSVSNVEDSIKRFAETGVKISITELDVTVAGAQGASALTDAQAKEQALKYGKLFLVFKNYAEYIERVTIWGMDDATSWRASQFPLLFDKNYQAKPAYYAAADPETYLAQNLAASSTIQPTLNVYRSDGKDAFKLWTDVKSYITAWETGATAKVTAAWNESTLSVTVNVTDTDPINSGDRRDSVELFIDEGTGSPRRFVVEYGKEYYDDGFSASSEARDGGWKAEIRIPFENFQPKEGAEILFEIQVNDAQADGALRNVAKWTGIVGDPLADTSTWGKLILK